MLRERIIVANVIKKHFTLEAICLRLHIQLFTRTFHNVRL